MNYAQLTCKNLTYPERAFPKMKIVVTGIPLASVFGIAIYAIEIAQYVAAKLQLHSLVNGGCVDVQ